MCSNSCANSSTILCDHIAVLSQYMCSNSCANRSTILCDHIAVLSQYMCSNSCANSSTILCDIAGYCLSICAVTVVQTVQLYCVI